MSMSLLGLISLRYWFFFNCYAVKADVHIVDLKFDLVLVSVE